MLPAGLTAAGRAVFHVTGSFLRAGVTRTGTLDALKELGLGYRRTDYFKDSRIIAEEVRRSQAIKFIRKDALLTSPHYMESEFDLPKRYRTIVSFDKVDPVTGEFIGRDMIAIDHDVLIKREDAEEMCESIVDKYPTQFHATHFMPVEGWSSSRR